jgi:hypothetical protein
MRGKSRISSRLAHLIMSYAQLWFSPFSAISAAVAICDIVAGFRENVNIKSVNDEFFERFPGTFVL